MCDEKRNKTGFQVSVRMGPEPEGFRFYFFHTKIRGTSTQRSPKNVTKI
jgi:hypothetical protein